MFISTWRTIALVVGETCLLIGAVAAATYIRLGEELWFMLSDSDSMLRALLVVAVCQVSLHYADLYDLRSIVDSRDLVVRLFQALGASSLILAFVYFWFPEWIIGRGVFLIAAILVISLVLIWRLAFTWLTKRVAPRERLLIVGTSRAGIDLARELFDRRHELGVELVGFVDPDPARVGAAVINPGVVGTIDDIPSIVRARSVDRVVVSLSDARGKLPMEKLLEMKLDGVAFDHLASVYEEYTGKIAVENLRPSWLIFSDGFKKGRVLAAAKRVIDVVVSCSILVITVPLMAAVAAVVKLTSHGPALYHQHRVGQHGRIFTVHKFRTMHDNAEAETGPVWAAKEGDARVTIVGRWLRRSRLDELPQLVNVLRGEMSLVGPRPERPEFVADLTREIPYYGQRHIIRPGITGWAQVRYTYGASTEDALQKLQYDLFYIKNLSLALDLVVIVSTLKIVILHKGA
jgi:sugar transferase (PEP-CTERM system associated)